MQSSLTHIGLDVHQRSISVAVLRAGASGADEDQVPNEPAAIRRLVARWGDPAALRVCYEAGPCGYGLQRQLASLGIDCQVIAPALIPRRAGDRVKTDRRDALKLARRVRPSRATATRRAGQPPALVAKAFAADRRLHARYWRLVERKKRTTVAAVAVARELAGVVWAVMCEPA